MAETYYIGVAPHNPLSQLTLAASAQLGFCTPNYLIQETFKPRAPWEGDLFNESPPIREGHLLLNDRPGLGIEPNEKVIDKHPFKAPTLPHRQFHPDGSVADW